MANPLLFQTSGLGPRERRAQGLFRGLTALGAGLLAGGAPRVGAPAGAAAFAPGLVGFQNALQQSRQEARQASQDELAQARVALAMREDQRKQAQADREQAAYNSVLARIQGARPPNVPNTVAPNQMTTAATQVADIQPELIEDPGYVGAPQVADVQTAAGGYTPAQLRLAAAHLAEGNVAKAEEALSPAPGARVLTPEEAAQRGLPPDTTYQVDDKGKISPVGETGFRRVDALADDYRRASQTFRDISGAYGNVESIFMSPNDTEPVDIKNVDFEDPTLAGEADLTLLVNYMKLIDPGSVVREGEVATAQNAGGVSEAVRRVYNNILEGKGDKLTGPQRRRFLVESRKLYNSRRREQDEIDRQFSVRAREGRVNPEMFIGGFLRPRIGFEGYVPQAAPPAARVSPAPPGTIR